MNCWVLIVLTMMLLYVPRAVLPRAQASASKRARPEIHGWLSVLHALTIAYCGLWHRLKTNGWAPLPESGPAILIANHTCGIDHLILQAGCRRVLGFMIAREYYEWNKISYFTKLIDCIPVNRDGRDLQATRTALRALEAGRVLPIFPEGKVTPSSGEVLGEIRPGAAFIAIRAGVPVIPAYIRGTPPTDQIGESLVTPSRSRVIFGQAIDLSMFDKRQAGDKDVLAEVSRLFRQTLLDLRDQGLPAEHEAKKLEPEPILRSDTYDAA